MMKEKIYLQVIGHHEFEATWCSDKINDDDIEYTKGSRYQIAREIIEEFASKNTSAVTGTSLDPMSYAPSLKEIVKWLDSKEEQCQS